MARTSQNFYSSKSLFAQINKTELGLLKQAFDLEPSDKIRQELLNAEIDWISYSQHEWPSGILWGSNGATLGECQNILSVSEFTRCLDTEQIYASYLNDYEHKVRQYIARLQERQK